MAKYLQRANSTFKVRDVTMNLSGQFNIFNMTHEIKLVKLGKKVSCSGPA